MSSPPQSRCQRPRTQSCSGGPDSISSAVFQRAQAAQPPPMKTSLTTSTLAGRGFTVTIGALAGARLDRDEQLAEVVGACIDRRRRQRALARSLRACFGSRSCSSATSSRTMLPAIVAQPFGAHLREPAAQLVAGQADRAADDDEVAGEAAADDRAGRVRAGAPAVARAEQVERGQRGDDLGRRGEQERLLGVEGERAAASSAPSTGRTSKAKLFAGRPEPRRIAATAGGSAPARVAARRQCRRGPRATWRRFAPRARPTPARAAKARQSAAATARAATAPHARRARAARTSCRRPGQSTCSARRALPPRSGGLRRATPPPCADCTAAPVAADGLARRFGRDAARTQVLVDAGGALQAERGGAARVARARR